MTRRTLRWLAVALGTCGLLWGMSRVLREPDRSGPQGTNDLLLPALSVALIVMALALAGILIRNLVKLIVDRKRGILGSKLRTKLVFFFLGLVLLPAIVLFIGSAQVIKETVEAILLVRTPTDELSHQSGELVEEWGDYFRSRCLAQAQAIASEIERDRLLDPARRQELSRRLELWRQRESLQLVWVLAADDNVLHSTPTPPAPQATGTLLEELVGPSLRQAASRQEAGTRFDRMGTGLLAQAAVPVRAGGPAAVAVATVVPTQIAANLSSVDQARRDYNRYRFQRRDVVRFYLTLVGVIFLVTLFVATWIGFYLSRRITVPIQELAAAAREISAGNLDVRVRTQVGDELGMLVDAFNEMAGELEESREVITLSTAELRRSNRALDERRRYIETLVANLSTAVVSLDAAGRATTVNPAARRLLGVGLAVGDNVRDVLERQGLDALAELLTRGGRHLGTVRRDLQLPGAAGARNVSVQVSPLDGGAEGGGTLLMVEDLTELLRAQKALAWQEVARRIAHEIKNPLTPIQLAAQRVRKKFNEQAPDLPEVLAESTAAIEREVAGLKRLVDEFSRFARMPELSPRPVEFSGVVESVLALYTGLTGVRWEVDLDPRVGWVTVDAEQMRRALINLIDNAVTAMHGRGTIRIATRANGRDGLLRIEVADSGPGIPLEDRDRMFVPYVSTKDRGGGLGLAIVHKVVLDHQGTIRVEENAPQGARFVIEIPR